jgi:hypothetical protein
MSVAKTSVRPGNRHKWEAMIVMRRFRLYKIKISCRDHIRDTSRMSEEIHVQPGASYYTLTHGGSRRKAQRIVEQLNSRYGLDVPIARTAEVRPLGASPRLAGEHNLGASGIDRASGA